CKHMRSQGVSRELCGVALIYYMIPHSDVRNQESVCDFEKVFVKMLQTFDKRRIMLYNYVGFVYRASGGTFMSKYE
ncbi:MAG: hypothetical protein MJ102_06855, partial [Clostridia bacterium]|nr:hypothetical protein [Clostridia bacterium]